MVCGKEYSGRDGPSLVVKNYWIWSGASYLCCDDIRLNERKYIYNKNFNLYIAFDCYYLDTSMEIDKTNKLNLWTMLTVIGLYFLAKSGSEEKRLLGWGIVLRLGLPVVVYFLVYIFLHLL